MIKCPHPRGKKSTETLSVVEQNMANALHPTFNIFKKAKRRDSGHISYKHIKSNIVDEILHEQRPRPFLETEFIVGFTLFHAATL